MGTEGEDIKTRPHPALDIQERGEIFFFYRPKVDRQEAHSPDDVQRMYIILRPVEDHPKESSAGHDHGCLQQVNNIEKQPLFRLLVMGKKSLPDPSRHGRSRPFWGFVDMVTTNPDDIKTALRGGEEYDTATKGRRRNSPARAFGEGVYRILKHDDRDHKGKGKVHTHLVYKLEFPPEDEENYEPQESLNVEREASFLIQIKNPASPRGGGGSGLEKKRRAVFPAHLQGEFGQLRFRPADPPDFLNYEGCEFLLISASDDIEEELGLELRTDDQKAAADDDASNCSDLLKTFGDTAVVAEPLLKGTWV